MVPKSIEQIVAEAEVLDFGGSRAANPRATTLGAVRSYLHELGCVPGGMGNWLWIDPCLGIEGPNE